MIEGASRLDIAVVTGNEGRNEKAALMCAAHMLFDVQVRKDVREVTSQNLVGRRTHHEKKNA